MVGILLRPKRHFQNTILSSSSPAQDTQKETPLQDTSKVNKHRGPLQPLNPEAGGGDVTLPRGQPLSLMVGLCQFVLICSCSNVSSSAKNTSQDRIDWYQRSQAEACFPGKVCATKRSTPIFTPQASECKFSQCKDRTFHSGCFCLFCFACFIFVPPPLLFIFFKNPLLV